MFSESFEKYVIYWNRLAEKNYNEMKASHLDAWAKAFQEWWLDQRKAQTRLINFLWTLEEIEKMPADVAKWLSALCEFSK